VRKGCGGYSYRPPKNIGSLKTYVSFAKEPYKRDDILHLFCRIAGLLWIFKALWQIRRALSRIYMGFCKYASAIMQGSFADVKGSFEGVQGSFADVKGSFEGVQGSFADVQGSFADVRDSEYVR